MLTVSRFASLSQYASPYWQKLLHDPIQLALENHTMEWGLLATLPNDDSLKNWMTKPVVEVYEEPKPSRVRFADVPAVTREIPAFTQEVEEVGFTTVTKQPKSYPNPSKICTVIVYNLPRDMTRDKLDDGFSQYGVIEQITIPKNNDPSKGPVGSIKGFAMIRFSNSRESAVAVAMEKARRIQIEFAKSDRK
jgi:hypothetical protein